MSSESEDEVLRKMERKKRGRKLLSDNDSNSAETFPNSTMEGSDDENTHNVKRKKLNKANVIKSDDDDQTDGTASFESSTESEDSCLSESDGSENSEESEEEGAMGEKSVESDVSDGQSEKCPICLNKFTGQDTGTPESCDHMFCLDCIQEWARNVNTCPVDRQEFNIILVKELLSDAIIRRIPVLNKTDEVDDLVVNDATFCEICGRGDREDRLLLCDACDLGYHCECLDPPLLNIPVDEWFCPACADNVEIVDEVRELVHNGFRPMRFGAPRRAIARTRASENVRSRIEQRRMTQGIMALDNLANGEAVARPAPTVARPKVTRRKYRRRRRKTYKKKSSSAVSKTKSPGTKKPKVRRKRKTRRSRKGKRTFRSRRAARPLLTMDSVKKRIANKLGLRRPPPGRTIPLVQTKSSGGERPFFGSRYDSGSTFSIFGDRQELIEFEDSLLPNESESEYISGGHEVLAARRIAVPHCSALHLKKAAQILNQPKTSKSI